ncbi:MAG: SMP-30/gluconolactonase/LRE family protein [Acidimicrobiia bacterium]|nr:SMP-30/gluconolactonase/LRE family protein [Acidimicrobiia bacterium]
MTTQVMLEGLSFGEGPRWHDGALWFSDFYRHGVFRLDEDGNEDLVVEVPTQPSGLGWLPDGDLLLVSMIDRKLLRRSADGTLAEHADLSDVAEGHCNDMVVAADGTAYVGNFGPNRAPATLAIVSADGQVRAGPDDLHFPNGTVITPDGATLIIAESMAGRLTAFDVGADGTLTGRRVWADLGSGIPDGICLDEAGAVWVADPRNAACFRVVEGGEVTDRIDLELNCFACMLGGRDRRTLYLVTAPTSGEEAAATRNGRIETIRVQIGGAGLP